MRLTSQKAYKKRMSADQQTWQSTNIPVEQEEVLAAVRRGGTLLLPHTRAARVWSAAFDQQVAAEGKQSWQAGHVLPWGAWTAALWNGALVSGVESRVLLNRLQERAIWKDVIARSSEATLQPVAVQAELAGSALRLLGSYDTEGRFATGRSAGVAATADIAAFVTWYEHFEQVCRQREVLPASHVQLALAELIRAEQVPVQPEYVLCGFGSLTPAQRLLLLALESAGARVRRMTPVTPQESAPALLRYDTPRQELQACAEWARQQLASGQAVSIAVVVPDLEQTKAELERELRTAVAPYMADVTLQGVAAPYESSSSRALGRVPMISHALLLLRWCAEDIALVDAGVLLRSRHLALVSSAERGAELELHSLWRQPNLRKTLSLARAGRTLAKQGEGEVLLRLEHAAQPLRSTADTYANFAARLNDLLHLAGWPGTGTLNSEEFQVVSRWTDLLDQLASLDLLGTPVRLQEFLGELEAAAGALGFLPENLGAPIQVMSLREANGTTADAVCCLHADDVRWPSYPAAHPLLPWQLQVELGMPGTDLERDEKEISVMLSELSASTGRLQFSYSSTAPEGARNPAPPVIRLVEQQAGSLVDAGPQPSELPSLLELAPDAEPLPPLPGPEVQGGTGVLTAQAQCGFRAFAEKRLFAATQDEPDAGLTPMERGEQVHGILHLFWTEVQSHGRLVEVAAQRNATGVSERDTILRRCIEQHLAASPATLWDAAYLSVQAKRLFRLLSAWLDFEASRSPFQVLRLEEKIVDVALGPLRLNMRVDRVDRVLSDAGEATLIIDYKTGPAAPRDWLGERPDQPQLPAYAVAGAAAAGLLRVDGLAFAAVRVGDGKMRLDGIADRPGLLKPVPREKASLASHLTDWQTNLETLAADFADGDASVEPKQYPKTCETCGQRMLCRVDAAALLQIDDPEQDGEDEEATAWT